MIVQVIRVAKIQFKISLFWKIGCGYNLHFIPFMRQVRKKYKKQVVTCESLICLSNFRHVLTWGRRYLDGKSKKYRRSVPNEKSHNVWPYIFYFFNGGTSRTMFFFYFCIAYLFYHLFPPSLDPFCFLYISAWRKNLDLQCRLFSKWFLSS